jgi:hypothetical protein
MYLPSLHWNEESQRWLPMRGYAPAELPPRVTQDMLPRPVYRIGERVRFSWYGATPWEGEIRGVQIAGGEFDAESEALSSFIQRKYFRPHSMVYLIQARGHMRMVAAPKVLGISTNTSRSAIWEHGYEDFD